jgi:hypothetical protein
MKKILIILTIISLYSCKKDEPVFVMPKCDCGEIRALHAVNDSTMFGYQVINNCTRNQKNFWQKTPLDPKYKVGGQFCKRSEFW